MKRCSASRAFTPDFAGLALYDGTTLDTELDGTARSSPATAAGQPGWHVLLLLSQLSPGAHERISPKQLSPAW
jgi:hypothetical protein